MPFDGSLLIRVNKLQANPFDRIVANAADFPGVRESWWRSKRWRGGDWLGEMRISGLPLDQLAAIFYSWLGNDVQERQGSLTWRGMVYEMELRAGFVTRRISLEDVANHVRCGYQELVRNGGFEDSTFSTGWTVSTAGGDTITAETTAANVGRGSKSAKLTNGGGGGSYLYQQRTVIPQETYRVSFYTRGDGTVAGRYRIYDVTNAASIIATTSTGITGTDYRRVTEELIMPDGCNLLRVYLYVPSAAGSAWFDDVSVQRLINGEPAEEMTNPKTEQGSINDYGTKQLILTGRYTYDEAWRERNNVLARRAYPLVQKTASQRRVDEPELIVRCAGYVFTTKWIYTAQNGAGNHVAASTLVPALLGECEFIDTTLVSASSNTIQLPEGYITVREALNACEEQAADGTDYRLYVRSDLESNVVGTFEPIDYTPTYEIRDGVLYRFGGGQIPVNEWEIEPGVVRDYDYPVGGEQVGSRFLDGRDFVWEEVRAPI